MSALVFAGDDGTLRVTSQRIAEGSQVQHKNVLELIDQRMPELEQFGGVAFETQPFVTPGGIQNRRVALLNEQQATLLLTFQRNTERVIQFKVALVKAFFDMAQQIAVGPAFALPQTFSEALRELASTVEAKEQVERELAIAAPKAGAYDVFLSTAGDYSVNEAAKVLSRDHGILTGEGRLRIWMLANGWMYRDGSANPRAYQTRIEQGVLTEKARFHYHPTSGEKVLDCPQVRVTTKGIDRLRVLLSSAASA